MDLFRRTWIVLKRRWPVLLAAVAIAVVAAAVYNTTADRTYTATTELFLRAPDMKTSASAYQGDLFSRQRAQTYSNMLGSDELAQSVIDELDLSMTPQELASNVQASTVTNTVIMTLSATDPNAQRAANIANAYGSVFARYVAKVENLEFDPNVPPLVKVITTATADTAVRSGFPASILLGGAAAIGLVIGIAAVWLFERYDTKLRSRRQIEDLSDSQLIGRLPRTAGLSPDSVSEAMRDSEEFRLCAQRIGLVVDRRLSRIAASPTSPVIAVVSSSDGDGRTVVAQALAETLQLRGLSSRFVSDLDALDEDAGSEEVATADADEEQAAGRRDIVVVDTPPFGQSPQAELIVESADAAIVVVKPGHSSQDELVDLASALRILDTPLLGVIANEANAPKTVDGIFD